MSLKEAFPSEIPAETVQVVEPLLPDDNVYRLIGECVGSFLSDADFQGWYAIEGRPGINPIILSMVTIFQFLEKLPDQAAAHMAVMRLDWKYTLRHVSTIGREWSILACLMTALSRFNRGCTPAPLLRVPFLNSFGHMACDARVIEGLAKYSFKRCSRPPLPI